MKIVRKPLKDVKKGDVLIDSDARLTTVTGETVEETPGQLFELEILNDEGRKMKVRVDAGHAWPLDPGAYGSTPPEAEGETEASTGDIARWVTRGWQPQLSPVLNDGTVMHWIVRRALLLPDSVARETKVKCVQVDSPTHSFMLADDPAKNSGVSGEIDEIHSAVVTPDADADDSLPGAAGPLSLDDLADMDIDKAPGVMHVDREAFDLIAKHGMPTHNCGGPLTLDTTIRTPDGLTTMGEVKTGDKILNPVGEETVVKWKSPLMIPTALVRLSIVQAERPGTTDWTISDLNLASMRYSIYNEGVITYVDGREQSDAFDGVDLPKVLGPLETHHSIALVKGEDDDSFEVLDLKNGVSRVMLHGDEPLQTHYDNHDGFNDGDASTDADAGEASDVRVVECDGSHLWNVYDCEHDVVRVVTTGIMLQEGIDKWLIPLEDGKWGEIYKAEPIDPEPVQCILVDDTSHSYQLGNGVITHNTGGGKSVLQRNVVFHVIAHARQIKFFGIDLKKVELSAYRPYSPVLYIATTLEDAVQVLTTAQDLMMSRYAEMEENHVNNFLDLDSPGSALLVMVDEAGELLDCSSPAKALGGGTPVKTLEDGVIPLRDVKPGEHHVLGTDLEWHEVVRRYEPEAQDHYRVTTVRSSDGARESFTAGSEHLWRVWVPTELKEDLLRIVSVAAGEAVEDHEDGSLSVVLTTRKLKALKDVLPVDVWRSVRLRRAAVSPSGHDCMAR